MVFNKIFCMFEKYVDFFFIFFFSYKDFHNKIYIYILKVKTNEFREFQNLMAGNKYKLVRNVISLCNDIIGY